MKGSHLQRLGLITVVFSLACAGFNEAFNEEMANSASELLSEARITVSLCSDGTPKTQFNAMLDYLDQEIRSGTTGGFQVSVRLGSIQSSAEDGCSSEDIDNLVMLYSDLGSAIGR